MSAYAEMCELAQRKFMQQVAQTATTLKGKRAQFHAPYPRLCFVDLTEEALERLNGKDHRPTTVAGSKKSAVQVDLSLITGADLVIKMMCEMDGVSW
jgi:hypothetical protein